MKRILNLLKNHYPKECQRIAKFLSTKYVKNINLNLCNSTQKRVLISYLCINNTNFSEVHHAAILHINQIIFYFIRKGYCIDICQNDDINSFIELRSHKYDIILGFGKVYKLFCEAQSIPIRINFITENNPEIVKLRYNERLLYFKERHTKISIKDAYPRIGYFDKEQFTISNYGIVMNSNYNMASFKSYIKNIYRINCNAIFNEKYKFNVSEISKQIIKSRNNFLWFGSVGIIHKGLDILIDTFKYFPNLNLNCYGIDNRELNLFSRIKGINTYNCGKINVLSDEFYNEIILKHNFIIFPSCSEGMSTAVATCMAHGIIPIITKETGFESCNCIIELESYHIECIKQTIANINLMSDEQILQLRKECYNYARENFSLDNFDTSFSIILDNILS